MSSLSVTLLPPNLFFPSGECPFTGITYGSRAYAMGRNWDCARRASRGRNTFCPCSDCFWAYYVPHYVRLQSVCRMLLVRARHRR